ncbi:EpsG family protein [Butyricicoccus porcorum]|uniref:EpsG family protein n=1 Tax=Butyricicoccus porcorum TaxID=1945634 RepID=UPI003F4A9036
MTLTNYWWLLIWMFTGGLFLKVFSSRKRELVGGQVETRWRMLPAIIMVVPYIIWAGYRNDIGDTYAYREVFKNAPATLEQLPIYLDEITKDKGFSALVVLIKATLGNSDVLFFLVLAAVQILCISVIFRKYSSDYWLSIFLFIASTDYLSWVFNGIRQFTAVTIIFAATGLILKRKYLLLIVVILLASTIHGSALLMLPVVFIIQGKAWNKKTVLCVLIGIGALIFVDQFTNILDILLSDTQYKNVVSDWETWGDDGTNPLRILVYSIPMLLSLIGYRKIKQDNNAVINMCVNASIISTVIGALSIVTSGIFIGRLPIYCSLYSYILLPWEIRHLFRKHTAEMIYVATIICYIIFFYYQTVITWGTF